MQCDVMSSKHADAMPEHVEVLRGKLEHDTQFQLNAVNQLLRNIHELNQLPLDVVK